MITHLSEHHGGDGGGGEGGGDGGGGDGGDGGGGRGARPGGWGGGDGGDGGDGRQLHRTFGDGYVREHDTSTHRPEPASIAKQPS